MNKYYVLYCNFTSGTYEIGFGKEGMRDRFFSMFRDKHDYDKYGRSYDEDNMMDLDVYEFNEKSEVIEFLSSNMGVLDYSSPEEYKQKQLKYAEDHFNAFKIVQL